MKISAFKFYLGRILGEHNEEQELVSGLSLYQQQFRSLVGQVLIQDDSLGPPGPYIPLFYQNQSPTLAVSSYIIRPP